MKHLSKLVKIIRNEGQIGKEELIIKSEISISWAEKLCKYIPILFTDIRFDKKHRQFIALCTLSPLEKELEK